MPMPGPPTPHPHISTRSVHTGTPSSAPISEACSYTPPFASSCGQPARCESLSSTSCPPRPLQAHSGCLLHNSYTRRIPRPGMLRSYLGGGQGRGSGKDFVCGLLTLVSAKLHVSWAPKFNIANALSSPYTLKTPSPAPEDHSQRPACAEGLLGKMALPTHLPLQIHARASPWV